MDASGVMPSSKGQATLCTVCKAIDWAEVIRETQEEFGRRGVNVRQFLPSDTHRILQLSPCPICRALATIKPWTEDGTSGNHTLMATRWASRAEGYKGRLDPPAYGCLALFYSQIAKPDDANISQQSIDANPEHSPARGPVVGSIQAVHQTERVVTRDDGLLHILGDRPDFTYVKTAEKICRSTHPFCQDPRAALPDLELLVIDCHTNRVIAAPADSEYVALSYVWGDVSTIPDLQGKEPEFPAVVRDSIQVALGLCYDYLWVDRYCIDQNSAYKERIIARMDEVYKQAAVVIIAITGDSANDGLPGISVRRDPTLETTVGSLTFRQIPPYGPHQFWRRRVRWLERGWTYQEGCLSRRRLFFTETQTLLICDSMVFTEAMTNGVSLEDAGWTSSGLIRRGSKRPLPKSWSHQQAAPLNEYLDLRSKIVWYSNRLLTFEDDSLRAFLGILNDHRHSGVRQHHIWGVPILHIEGSHGPLIALDWTHGSKRARRRRLSFPSWSWIGWEGPVRLPEDPNINLSWVCLDPEQTESLGEVYQNLNSSDGHPRRLYLRAATTEIRFIAEDLVRPAGGDANRMWGEPNAFAVLPVTETEHMVVGASVDDFVEVMKPYLCLILEEAKLEPHPPPDMESQKATLLVMREVNGHMERVGVLETGETTFDGVHYSTYGVSSIDLENGIMKLSDLEGPKVVMQQLWRQKAEERTICLS
ncbi:uncharacterized protein PG998_010066 [Apiospora kogelbergensis]|uniref:uncharacterized protein n=1 Tax=Apiospora kogelbergensis TaxID=1337665 RepID=UPI0031318F80